MFKINDYIVYNKDICKIEKIIKTTYLRNEKLSKYNEFSIVLNKTFEETK